jgi:hypothetical protein
VRRRGGDVQRGRPRRLPSEERVLPVATYWPSPTATGRARARVGHALSRLENGKILRDCRFSRDVFHVLPLEPRPGYWNAAASSFQNARQWLSPKVRKAMSRFFASFR